MKATFFYVVALMAQASCNRAAKVETKESSAHSVTQPKADSSAKRPALSLAAMLAQKEVPVLCYHHIRNFSASQSESMKSYSVTPANFAAQMKALHDSGYQTILPAQLYDYLVYGSALPAKPIMITFDDTQLSQFTIGAKEMDKYGFKGVFFIMTISIG
ncbi:MAG: polysaccharide deacetylase family protein, partial [Chitinophagaceae bacterium]